jgi:hypothetical protein
MAKREAYVACSLKHPNVVEGWDMDEKDDEVTFFFFFLHASKLTYSLFWISVDLGDASRCWKLGGVCGVAEKQGISAR